MNKHTNTVPTLGFGLGLRYQHYPHIFEHKPAIDWFEIISENFMDTDGKPKRNLARVAEQYPIVMHGVALSIGTVDPLNSEYLHKLKKLADWVKPAWISDHLCWTGVAHQNSHDLLPVPYTEEALRHVVSRIKQVQDFLGRPIALENPSTYLEFQSSQMPEAEFIARMAQESGCNLLLDVNNVYVTCYNHRLDAQTYIDALPLDKVIQIHLSGHSNYGTHIIDTHDDYVVDEVWALYGYVLKKMGRIPNTMVEWDGNIPEFPVLQAELNKAKTVAAEVVKGLFNRPMPDLFKPQISFAAPRVVTMADEQSQMFNAVLNKAPEQHQPDQWIKSKELFPPTAQLGVYINAYHSRLYDITAEDYPVLEHYLGADVFDVLIKDFVATQISDHFNIGRFPAKLPDFLVHYGLNDSFAAELCELESAVSQLTDPPETTALTPDHLTAITPDTLMESVLHPRQALRLFSFDYAVNNYYCAVKESKASFTPEHRATYLVVFRHEDTVWRMDLDAREYTMLQMLFSGMNVGAALDKLQSDNTGDDKIESLLSHWFARWIRNGLLAFANDIERQPQKNAV